MDQSNETSFVYYLVSNASMNVYSDNKPQQFRNLLSVPLNLEGEWEVGLSTIIYPHNWNPIKADSKITVFMPSQSIIGATPGVLEEIDISITIQLHKNLDDFVKSLNETINKALANHRPLQAYTLVQSKNATTYNYVEFALASSGPKKLQLKDYFIGGGFKIVLPNKHDEGRDLWRKLGCDDSVVNIEERFESKYEASFTLHLPSLLVYMPIIDYVGVGDTYAPLFSIVPIRGNIGEYVYERFDKPIYHRVNQNHIAEIEVSIKDDVGDNIKFGAGKTILVLHFRRRS